MITTVEKLKENLNSNFKDKESIYVLFFSKSEIEEYIESDIKDSVWLKALQSVDDEIADKDVFEQITEAARRLSVDLIIVGHRRPKGWADRWWRGSIGASLMDATHCSVLIAMNACGSAAQQQKAA